LLAQQQSNAFTKFTIPLHNDSFIDKMKWATLAAALVAIPTVLAGAIDVEVLRRTDHGNGGGNGNGNGHGNGHVVVVTEVIVLWVNQGDGATTTLVNSASSIGVVAAQQAVATHTVVVGGEAGLKFTPDQVEANIGDSVVFVFQSQNHTVTQSTFDSPCVRLPGGFDTGFMPNPNNTVVPPPMVAMQVAVDTPLCKIHPRFLLDATMLICGIGFYCRQTTPGNHCGKGMTFSINPSQQKSQGAFANAAIAQNGTVASSAAPPALVASAPPASVEAATVAAAVPTESAVAPAAATGVVSGSGQQVEGEACSCSCFCGVGSFPLPGQGAGMVGGISGALPASAW
jgi:plastocyanin